MTETTNELLQLDTITEPFDLATALKYMGENGEFIRGQIDGRDFYMYKDTQKRPSVVKGKRQFVDVTTVWAFDRYNNSVTTLNMANLFDKTFHIMRFDENGNPDWTEPKATEV